jgi:hypothetical protein
MMSNKKEKNMARPQTVNQLPDDVKQELNKKLTENSFSGYVQLTEWLNSLGYAVSKSSVHRYAERRRLSLIADSDALVLPPKFLT